MVGRSWECRRRSRRAQQCRSLDRPPAAYNAVVHSATTARARAAAGAHRSATPRENVDAVTRALRLLDAFLPHEQGVRLSELSRRLGMDKSTLLRTARTLARSGYLTQLEDSRWRLGPAAGSIGVRYQTSFDIGNDIDVVLRRLASGTDETAAFFVLEGDARTCIARVDRPSLERHHIRIGERLPLDRGASAHVLMAFSGATGAFYNAVRRSGHYVSIGERDSRMSSIAVPAFGARRKLAGALCISGLAQRLGQDELLRHLPVLLRASQDLSQALAHRSWGEPKPAAWHP
jgi:DNA-binding IclR family transcriptional regulator